MVDKRELLNSMWEKVADIRDGMGKVEEHIYTISDCLDSKKFLPPEAAECVRENLGKISDAGAYVKDNYEALSGEEFTFEDLSSLEKSLQEIDVILTNRDEVDRAKRFLTLVCDDETAAPKLIEEQEKVAGIIGDEDSYTVAKSEEKLAALKPYARFLAAFAEKRMVQVLDYIPELREGFDDELVAALVDKQIREVAPEAEVVEEADAAPELPEESVEEPAEPEMPQADEVIEEIAEAVAEEPEIEVPVDDEIEVPIAEVPADDEIEVPIEEIPSDDEIEVPAMDVPADEEDIPVPVVVSDAEDDIAAFEVPVDEPADLADEPIPAMEDIDAEEPEIALPTADDEEIAEPAMEIPIDEEEPVIEIPADDLEPVEEPEPIEIKAENKNENKNEGGGFFSRWF